jgi:hypothetical protein
MSAKVMQSRSIPLIMRGDDDMVELPIPYRTVCYAGRALRSSDANLLLLFGLVGINRHIRMKPLYFCNSIKKCECVML